MENFLPVSLLTNFHSLKYDVLALAILRSCLDLMSEIISMQKFFSLKFDAGKGVRLIHECILYMDNYGSWKAMQFSFTPLGLAEPRLLRCLFILTYWV